jgi:AraC-like DNA-binding protein
MGAKSVVGDSFHPTHASSNTRFVEHTLRRTRGLDFRLDSTGAMVISSDVPPHEYSLPFQVPFIRWADVAVLAPGSAAPARRRIYDHEFVYVLSGAGHISIEGIAHEARPDSLFLVQPRSWHSYRADSGCSMTLLGVHFDWTPQADTLRFPVFRAVESDNLIDDSLFRRAREVAGWDLGSTPFLDLRGRPDVRRALENVVAEYAREDEISRRGAGALLAFAVAQIEREARRLRIFTRREAAGPDAMRRLERARALLETPRDAPLSIEEVAQNVGWSADHLRRTFRAVWNVSPARIQTAARIRRARELMRNDRLPVSQVAQRCGFEDASHFARVFKKESGLSPREFRMLAKKTR